ncbi:pyridine nucleotide-disulfide oxidoreductase [Anaerovibrio lipolyticus]|uniref:NADH:ubiquinone reductase (non-electrogenic) n=1 Tax=Anaerovibrio lipolyticus TaxID=82374 RepID=A0A0B2K2F2_9FIRM|nr:NAD(P)/FAD-dependent oxidoreductase [Anaerovibrio lipolyticus]KHM52951.1 pyridine nucleotide-disulfide oxidoreductase [Anaerovibrio lipolyticus]
MTEKIPHVVIVGAGFGGVAAMKALKNVNVKITWVDRTNYHLFQPLLYQLSTAVLSTDDISFPVRAMFRKRKNMDLFMAKATGIDGKNKILHTNHGDISYDYLIVAAGATNNFFGMENVEKYSYGMKTIQEALHIRNHALHMFERANKQEDSEEERRKMLTFVCVGGGPTGVEEAGALAELVAVQKLDYPNLNFDEVSIKLIEATDRVLPMMPDNLQKYTLDVLKKKGVEVMLNTQVADCSEDGLTLKDGTFIPSRTVIWAAGVRAHDLASTIGAECDRAGRVIVEKTLQVPGYPEIFAIGDNAHFLQDGRPLPTVAPVANQEARAAADNIVRMIKGEKLQEFVYKDYGSMATIGRCEAVVSWGFLKIGGFFAWVIWMFLHLMRLEGAHEDITVGIKWFWNFISGARLGRIITNIRFEELEK